MGSAILEGGRSANTHEFCFQAAKLSDRDFFEVQASLFAERQEWHFLRLRNVQI